MKKRGKSKGKSSEFSLQWANRDLRIDNLGNATRWQYDSRDNPVITEDPNGTATSGFTLTRGGPPAAVQINDSGNKVVRVFDGLNRTIQVDRELKVDHDGDNGLDLTNPNNTDGIISVFYDWDPNSPLKAITDDNDTNPPAGVTAQSTTGFVYDELNRVTRKDFADETFWTRTYDRDSNVVTATDPNGSILTPTYDDLSRTTQLDITPAAPQNVQGTTQQTFEYDGLSRITRATDDNGGTTASDVLVSWDSLSRNREESQQIGAEAPRLVTRVFDQGSNRIQLQYPSLVDGNPGRRLVDYEFDGLDRETRAIEESTGQVISEFTYIGPGRVETRTMANQVTVTYSYDQLRRKTRVVHTNPGGTFMDFEYAYDRVGNRLMERFHHEELNDQEHADFYGYDSAGRLVLEAREVIGDDFDNTAIANNQAPNPAPPGFDKDHRDWTLDGRDRVLHFAFSAASRSNQVAAGRTAVAPFEGGGAG